MAQVQCIGYIVDENGFPVDVSKIQSIRDWLVLTTLTLLCSFLGFTNFFHRFMLGLSHIAWPLKQVTKGGGKAKFMWAK